MSIETNGNFDHLAEVIDGKKTDFQLIGNDARFHEREARATQEAPFFNAAAFDALGSITPVPEKPGPRHRAEEPLKGALDIIQRNT